MATGASKALPKGAIGTVKAAALIEVTPRRLQQLVADGYIEKLDRGLYNPLQVFRGYIRFKDAQIAAASRTADEAELRRARIREIELRTAVMEGDLMPTAEAMAVLDQVLGIIRSGLSGMPARLTRDLDLRDELEDGINDVLRAAAKRLFEAAGAAGEGGEAAAAAAQDDAGRVGGGKQDVPAKRRPAGKKKPARNAVHDPGGKDGGKGKG